MKGSILLTCFLFLLNLTGNGQVLISYPLDSYNRPTAELYPDSNCIKYTFDSANNIRTKVIENPCYTRPNPIITYSRPLTFCQGDSTVLSAPASLSYRWSRGDTTPAITVKQSGSYTVTTFNTLNCYKTSIPIIVAVNPLPQPIIDTSGPTSFCPGLSVTLTSKLIGIAYTWNTSSTDTARSIIADTTKNYILTYTDSNGCQATATKQVTLFARPNVAFSIPNTAQCLNGNSFSFINTSSISTGSISYLWTLGEGLPDTSHNQTHVYSSSGTYPIKLLATSDHSCNDSALNSVSVFPKPNVGFIINNPSQCVNSQNFIFTDTSRISYGSTSSQWDFGDSTGSTNNNPTKTYTTADSYNVKLVSISNNQCRDSINKQVTVNPKPDVGYTINNDSQCLNGNSFVFLDTSRISYVTLSRIWNLGDATTDTTISKIKAYSSANTYNVKLVSISNNQCKDSITKQIIVQPKPNVGFTVNNTIQCVNGNNFLFNDTSSISNGSLTRNWSFGDGTTSLILNPTKSYQNANNYIVKLIESSDFGCKDSATKSITVHPKPNVGFVQNNTVRCFTDNAVLVTDTSTISSGTMIRQWNFGDNTFSSDSIFNKAYLSPGIYNIKLLQISNNLCKDSIYKTFTVHSQTNINFTINTPKQCFANNSYIFVDTSSGIHTRIWRLGDNSIDTNAIINKSYMSDGSFTVKLITTTINGCTDSIQKIIVVYPQTQIGFFINNTYQCLNGNEFVFTDTSSGATTRLWRFGDGTTSSVTPANKTYGMDSTYFVKLITTTTNGCLDSIQKTIIVYPQPKAGFTQNKLEQCLLMNSFVLIDTSTISSGTKTRLWDFDDGTTSTSISNNKNFNNPGTYNIKLVETSGFNCKDSVSKSFTVYPQTEIGFTINNPFQCFGINRFLYTDTSILSSGTYLRKWYLGDGDSAITTQVNKTYNKDTTFNVKLVTTTNNGCIDSLQKSITVHPQTKAGFTINIPEQCLSGNSFLFNDTSIVLNGTHTRLWQIGDDSDYTASSVIKIYSKDSSYIIKLFTTTNQGCRDSIQKLITVFPQPSVGYNQTNFTQCFSENDFNLNDTSKISSGVISRKWHFGDNTTSADSSIHKTFANAGIFNIKLIIVSGYNCKDSVTKSFSIYPQALPGFVINDSTQCVNGNIYAFSSTSIIDSGYLTYFWNLGNGTTKSDSNFIYSYLNPGTYKVKLLTISNHNCKDSITKQVTVNPKPSVGFTINIPEQCINTNNFLFIDTSKISSGSFNKIWRIESGVTSILDTVTYQYSVSGQYFIKLVAASDQGCTDSLSKLITVHPKPFVRFIINDSTQCLNTNQFLLFDSSTITNGSISSSWDFGDGDSSMLKNPIKIYVIDSTYKIKLISISDFGCRDSLSKDIIVFPKPIVQFVIGNDSQCINGNNFNLINNSTINSGTFICNWFFGDGHSSSAFNTLKSYASPGMYKITLLAISDLGCTDSITKLVLVFPKPDVGFMINLPAQCVNNNSFQFIDTTKIITGNLFRSWDFGDGGNYNADTAFHQYNLPGNFAVKLVSVSENGCTDSVNKPVVVYPKPSVGFIVNDSNQCLYGNSFLLIDTSSIITGTTSSAWNFGDGNTSISDTAINIYKTPNIYLLKLVSTSDHGCKDSLFKNIEVYPDPIVGFMINDSVQCLKGNRFIFIDTSTILNGSYSIVWDFGNGDTTSILNPYKTYNKDSTYFATLIATSNHGCKDSISKIIIVNPQPKALITVLGISNFCDGKSVILNANQGSGLNYKWLKNGYMIPLEDSSKYFAKSSGNYAVIVSTPEGCRDTSNSVGVNVYPIPSADIHFSGDTTFCSGDSLILNVNFGNGITYRWFKNDTVLLDSIKPNIVIKTSGKYKIKVSQNGCDNMSPYVLVTVIPKPDKPVITQINNTLTSNAAYGNQWFINGNKINGAIVKSYAAKQSGNYKVTVTINTNGFGCSESSDDYPFLYIDENPPFELNVYPNPNDGSFTVSSSIIIEDYEIWDASGKELMKSSKQNSKLINIKLTFSSGAYFLRVNTNKGTGVKCFVITR